MIMKELIEVSAQIGGMHSDNPVINFVYTIIKKRKLKEVIKKIDALPAMPSDDDIIEFASMYPILKGMDVDGDTREFRRSDGTLLGNLLYSMSISKYTIYPENDMDNAYSEYVVNVMGTSIEYSGIRANSLGQHPTKINPRYPNAYFGNIIKIGLKQICTDMILGGNYNVHRNR